MRDFKRIIFDYPDLRFQKGSESIRFRVRDEGDKVALNFKQRLGDDKYDDEIEVVVDSFDNTVALVEAIGLKVHSYQESRRESWSLDGCEVVLDEWPWLEPYIEIEGPSESAIRGTAEKLGFDWDDAKHGSIDTAYRAQYKKMTMSDSIGYVSKVTFNSPLPEYLQVRK